MEWEHNDGIDFGFWLKVGIVVAPLAVALWMAWNMI